MDLAVIGGEIRRARLARGITQKQLAAAAGVTRTTLNRLENGLLNDLGIRKIKALLDQLSLTLKVADTSLETKSPDFLRLASTSASVSFKEKMTERELSHVLLTGKIPPALRPHLRTLLEESPQPLLQGLIRQISRYARPGRLQKNLDRIADSLQLTKDARKW